MRRRKFISLIAGGAVAWPMAARAQQGERIQRIYRVAVLIHGPERAQGRRFEALRTGLRELGYIEGQNLKAITNAQNRLCNGCQGPIRPGRLILINR